MDSKRRLTVHDTKMQAILSMKSMMRMLISPSKIVLDPDPIQTSITYKLGIDRQSHKIGEYKDSVNFIESRSIYGLIGIMKVFNKQTVIYIEEADVVGVLQECTIYQITKVNYLFLDNHKEIDLQQMEFFDHLCKFFSTSFYFSFTYDLTQRKKPSRYWWNQHIVKSLPEVWQLKIIQGYVGSFQTTFKSTKQIQYFLITRRSTVRAGSIKNDIGLDQDGNAANFSETEQIIIFEDQKNSIRFTRGSTPLLFEQNIMNSQISMTKEMEVQKKCLIEHLSQFSAYQKIILVNLLDDGILTTNLEKLLVELKMANLSYIRCNFTKVLKDYSFQNLNQSIEQVNLDYTSAKRQQKTIIRINCQDCLDQTNIYMSKFALRNAQEMLQQFINIEQEFGTTSLLREIDQPSMHTLHPFLIYFRQKWAENGHNLKKVYKISKSTNNLKQFNRDLIEDKLNQDVIDSILGHHHSTNMTLQNITMLEKEMKKRNSEYVQLKDISVYVVTWNINAHFPSDQVDYSRLFDIKHPLPEIIAVGFQELVPLNVSNVVAGNNFKEQSQQWRTIIGNVLPDYVLVAHQVMVGIFVMIFVHKSEQTHVLSVETECVKYGFGQKLGNKGGVILKLRFYDSYIGFINCHLPAGPKKNDDRLQCFDYIHTKADLDLFDWIIAFGDMNFRINLNYDRVIESLNQYNNTQIKGHQQAILNQLKENDQFKQERNKSHYLKHYTEHEITFPPTYKFDIGTDRYDTSEKRRVPSFTDRILLYKVQNINTHQTIYYNSLYGKFQVSDHRPVVCQIKTQVCQVKEDKKENVFKSLVQITDDIDLSDKYFQKSEQVRNFDLYLSTRQRDSYVLKIIQTDINSEQWADLIHPFPEFL